MLNLRTWLLQALILIVVASPALAFRIDEVTSPGGIKAWLVQDKAVPLIAMKFSFRGGSAHDPAGKEGVANFLTGMMDEGAADLDSATFQRLRDELSFKMDFDAERDHFEGLFQTLSHNRDASFELLRKVLTQPRFDAAPLELVRRQLLLSVQERAEDPEQTASSAWMKIILPGDPYAREATGTLTTVGAVSANGLRRAHGLIFNRQTLQVAVVGDIDGASLGLFLDHVFGGLPVGKEPPALPPPKFTDGPALKIISRDIPQSVIVFGHEGIIRNDPEFIPAYMMTEILGGGGFGSRLIQELREKRGLTYGASADLAPLGRAGFFIGSLGTRNEKAGEALSLIKQELDRMAKEGPTVTELADAKTYLTGSYALRFDGNATTASQLLGLQQDDLGLDYVATRNARIEAVTLEQVRAQAKRLLHGDKLIVTVVGQPEGLTN